MAKSELLRGEEMCRVQLINIFKKVQIYFSSQCVYYFNYNKLTPSTISLSAVLFKPNNHFKIGYGMKWFPIVI